MSALPLAMAGPISSSEAFYIPPKEASHAAETLSQTWEAMPPTPNDTEKLEVSAAPPGSGFEIAVDLDSAQDSYIGEDARLTQLRDIYTLFRKWARESAGSSTRISAETLCFLPGILRTLIQFVQEIQSQNARLRGVQEALQTESRQMEANMNSLRAENKIIQDAREQSKHEIDVLKKEILQMKELYASTKAQKDGLEEQPNEIKTRAASDRSKEDSSNKRRRRGSSSSRGLH